MKFYCFLFPRACSFSCCAAGAFLEPNIDGVTHRRSDDGKTPRRAPPSFPFRRCSVPPVRGRSKPPSTPGRAAITLTSLPLTRRRCCQHFRSAEQLGPTRKGHNNGRGDSLSRFSPSATTTPRPLLNNPRRPLFEHKRTYTQSHTHTHARAVGKSAEQPLLQTINLLPTSVITSTPFAALFSARSSFQSGDRPSSN